MLTHLDDFLNHQIPQSFDHVASPHRNWTEKMWFSAEDTESGEILVVCGIGQYPNRDVQDAFAGASYQGKQYNVRMSRQLRPDIHRMKVGPLSIDVVEGLRTFQLVLDDNPSGMSFDLEWAATSPPHEEAHHFEQDGEDVIQDLDRYAQVGRASGIVRIAGETFEVRKKTWYAQRDHSWGIRPWVGSDSQQRQSPSPEYGGFFTWWPVQFDRYSAFCFLTERAPGTPGYLSGGIVRTLGDACDVDPFVAVEHDFRFRSGAPVLTLESGSLLLTTASGIRAEIAVRALPARYHLRGGLYGGYRGWWHGDWKGPYYFEHDAWDLNDAAVVREAGFFGDHLAEFRFGNDVGYGIIEYAVTPGYPKYKEFQAPWA